MSERIPIMRVGDTLLASIQTELHDRLAVEFTDQLAGAVREHRARGVVLDISAVDLVDSFMARMLRDLATTLGVLGAEAVVVGMRPQVAITLVELGAELDDMRTALDVEQGLAELGAAREKGADARALRG